MPSQKEVGGGGREQTALGPLAHHSPPIFVISEQVPVPRFLGSGLGACRLWLTVHLSRPS